MYSTEESVFFVGEWWWAEAGVLPGLDSTVLVRRNMYKGAEGIKGQREEGQLRGLKEGDGVFSVRVVIQPLGEIGALAASELWAAEIPVPCRALLLRLLGRAGRGTFVFTRWKGRGTRFLSWFSLRRAAATALQAICRMALPAGRLAGVTSESRPFLAHVPTVIIGHHFVTKQRQRVRLFVESQAKRLWSFALHCQLHMYRKYRLPECLHPRAAIAS